MCFVIKCLIMQHCIKHIKAKHVESIVKYDFFLYSSVQETIFFIMSYVPASEMYTLI